MAKTYYKCMLCGSWHEDKVGGVLTRHIHDYYRKGGTIPLSKWERRKK